VFAIADDGRAFLQKAYGKREGIYCLSLQGEVLWQFPEPTQPEQVLALRNFSAFLILPSKYSSGNALQLYVRR
jgi:outer membrane protein assembly factor BamB